MTFDKAAWLERQKLCPQQFRPKKGFVANPLRKYPRNDPCLCGSGKKWKRCCEPDMPLYIPKSEKEDHERCLRGEI